MFTFLRRILKDEFGGTLSITRKVSNTLITASGFNTNYAEIEAVVNGGIEADNIADDAITAAKLNSDVVRADYGLKQHTDGSLQVDVSDTNPALELTDGGLRAKVKDGILSRGSSGLDWGQSGDVVFSSAASAPTGFTDISATYADKFIRISSTALSTGGSDTHTHAAGSYTVNTQHRHTSIGSESGIVDKYALGSAYSDYQGSTAAAVSGTSASGDNVPAYVTLKAYQKD